MITKKEMLEKIKELQDCVTEITGILKVMAKNQENIISSYNNGKENRE